MYAFGLIVSALAIGQIHSASYGWLVLGIGLIVAAVFEICTGKEIE